MGKIDKKSPNTILHCLNSFCNLSGQNINFSKSKIIISKNCPKHTFKALAKLFNISISNSFGKYLGFSITNNKLKSADYQLILDNMTNRLASWKLNFFSMAGRTTLAFSALNSIPNHIMQYN